MQKTTLARKNNPQSGLGTILLILLVALFIIWVLTGGSKNSDQADKPFINPYNDSSAPLQTYGPGDAH